MQYSQYSVINKPSSYVFYFFSFLVILMHIFSLSWLLLSLWNILLFLYSKARGKKIKTKKETEMKKKKTKISWITENILGKQTNKNWNSDNMKGKGSWNESARYNIFSFPTIAKRVGIWNISLFSMRVFIFQNQFQ